MFFLSSCFFVAQEDKARAAEATARRLASKRRKFVAAHTKEPAHELDGAGRREAHPADGAGGKVSVKDAVAGESALIIIIIIIIIIIMRAGESPEDPLTHHFLFSRGGWPPRRVSTRHFLPPPPPPFRPDGRVLPPPRRAPLRRIFDQQSIFD